MDIITIIAIAFGLSMDALAVSITNGLTIKQLRVGNALKIALFFGLFQALMPVIGWMAGLGLRDFIVDFDHWVIFGLLSFIGFKMIYTSIKKKSDKKEFDQLNIAFLLIMSVAVSIDALAVGVSFSLLTISLITPIMVIGMVTFLLSFFGVIVGNRIGHFFENKIEIVGGLILIGIGIKILIEHSG